MIERIIVSQLLRSDSFLRKALPNIRAEYFRSGDPERVAFELIQDYVSRYDRAPAPEAMAIELSQRRDLSQELFDRTVSLFADVVSDDSQPDPRWVLDKTEEWCQDRAIHGALSKSLQILTDTGERGLSKGSIPKLLQDALAVTFDPHIGHDYLDDADERFAGYHLNVRRVPFDLSSFNSMTRGGLLPKTLNVVMAVSGAGKSLFMCHCAAANLMAGHNVLYITLELSKEMVSSRVDANLMGVDMGDLSSMPESVFKARISEIRRKTTGKLITQEYSQAGAAHFRHLLSELRIKRGFVPDVIYIDYLNLCVPTSRKGEMTSYERVKCVAEEIRAIAIDNNIPIVSATQTNRSGFNSSSVDETNVSDSIGLIYTCDLFFALVRSEQLDRMGQYKVIQLKSRYDDIGRMKVFNVGVERSRMRLYDLDDPSRDDTPVSDGVMDVIKGGRLDLSGFKFS